MTEGKKNDKNHYNGKRNGGGRLRKVESFSGDFSEGRNAGRSGDGDEIRKTKHNHAATNRKNRKRTGDKMNEYQRRKAQAIATAQEWQQEASNTAQSYGELLTAQAYFSKMAKRYGLIKEFRENGIL